MTIAIGIRYGVEAIMLTDCLATVIDSASDEISFTNDLKVSVITKGIIASLVGDANSAKEMVISLSELVKDEINLSKSFTIIEDYLNIVDQSDKNYFELLIMSRHSGTESNIYYFKSSEKGLTKLKDREYIVLGSGREAVFDKLTSFINSGLGKFCFCHKFPLLLSMYLNQWCFGENVHEGFISRFGTRIYYIYQNEIEDIFQPTTAFYLVDHRLKEIKVRMFTHFWDDYGLIIYDSYKHLLSYLFDVSKNVPKWNESEEKLFERMRSIYFNHPHESWGFIFLPDNEHYDVLRSDPFKFKDGEESFPLNIKERLDKIAQYYNKPAMVTFGEN